MIDDYVLGWIKGAAEVSLPDSPKGLGTWRWFLVPAYTSEGGQLRDLTDVELDIPAETDLKDPEGRPILSQEKVHITVLLPHKLKLGRLPYVRGIRLGWDERTKIVCWSVLG